MHPNTQLINDFYSAFQKKDYAGMNACYHPQATFKDEAFDLKGKEVQAMWHMLCKRGKDLEIIFSGVEADDETGKAYWEAVYTFSQTKRKVHNKIHASFRFKDGKIIKHVDQFNFWKWSSMALGPVGTVLGWSGFLKKKVRDQAGKSLKAFISSNSIYQD